MGDIVFEVRRLLAEAGMHTVNAFPAFRLPHLASPMVAVGQSDMRIFPCDSAKYIGSCSGSSAFGAEIEYVIQCDIFSPYRKGGQPCAEAVRTALTASSAGLDFCTLKAIHVTPVYYDENCDCFRGSVRLTFGALLYESES